jgi:hypothetical protein
MKREGVASRSSSRNVLLLVGRCSSCSIAHSTLTCLRLTRCTPAATGECHADPLLLVDDDRRAFSRGGSLSAASESITDEALAQATESLANKYSEVFEGDFLGTQIDVGSPWSMLPGR